MMGVGFGTRRGTGSIVGAVAVCSVAPWSHPGGFTLDKGWVAEDDLGWRIETLIHDLCTMAGSAASECIQMHPPTQCAALRTVLRIDWIGATRTIRNPLHD